MSSFHCRQCTIRSKVFLEELCWALTPYKSCRFSLRSLWYSISGIFFAARSSSHFFIPLRYTPARGKTSQKARTQRMDAKEKKNSPYAFFLSRSRSGKTTTHSTFSGYGVQKTTLAFKVRGYSRFITSSKVKSMGAIFF